MLSSQGRNLSIAIVGGLVFSLATSAVAVDGTPLPYFLIQYNYSVYLGAFWQLLTSIFVVIPFSSEGPLGVIDVVFNAAAVIWLDGLLAHAFEEREYYGVFLLSALVGNLASLFSGPNVASFGASGGIFGLLAGAIGRDYAMERRVNYSLVAWFLAVFILSSFLLSYVDWQAHLGGAVAGLVAGYLLGPGRGVEEL